MNADTLPTAAFVVVFDSDGQVLLVAQEFDRKRFGLPGGGIEPGESPADAAIRELREEAGVDIELRHLVGMFRFRGRLDFLAFVFTGTVASGTARVPLDDDVIDLDWFSPHELPPDLTMTAPYTLGAALNGERGIIRDVWLGNRP